MLAPLIQSDFLAVPRQVIALYFADNASATIVPQATTGGFSGALIWRVELSGRSYCLRRWPEPGLEPTRLLGLHRLLKHTAELGLTQIAVPLHTRDGKTLVLFDGRWWQLEPWLPGVADFQQQPTRGKLREAMQVLARWHLAARQFVPSAEVRTWFGTSPDAASPGIGERCQKIEAWLRWGATVAGDPARWYLDPEVGELLSQIWHGFERSARTIRDRLEFARSLRVPLQPCLRDVWHDHLLFTSEQLTGLIDPSTCRMENVTTDLARLLGSLVGDDRPEWDFAIDCYQQLRPLSLSELKLLTLFDESGTLLSGMTWVDWLVIQKRQFANRSQVVERLRRIVGRLRSRV